MMKQLLLLLLLSVAVNFAFAQEWMTGYSYRKKITVDKSKVTALNVASGSTVVKQDLPNFPVLIQIQDNDLIHVPGLCGNKILNEEGRDISFALGTTPKVPLNFQIESYEAETGKLTCWVKIPLLSANGTLSTATSFYLYYGSAILHDPIGPSAINVWSGDFSRIWHFKRDRIPAGVDDACSGISSQAATGSTGMNDMNFVDAKIGKGVSLNGSNEYLNSGLENSTSVHFSAWIKPTGLGHDQVILANDSVNGDFRNGYVFKITAAGKLSMEFYTSKSVTRATSTTTLEANKWQHVVGAISETQFLLYLNGVKIVSTALGRLGSGGSVSIGKSKQNSANFSGMIDELRILKTAKSQEWLKNEYVNQNDPAVFYTVADEEYPATEFWKFTGTVSNLWNVAGNWTNGTVPVQGKSVIIPAGKSVKLSNTMATTVGQLYIGAAASLILSSDLAATCQIQIANGGAIKMDNDVQLKCSGNVTNDGAILLNQATGTLVFEGNNPLQVFSGNGICTVYGVENNQSLNSNLLSLKSTIRITGYANLKRGVLNSDHTLTLAAEASGSACLLPIPLNEASLTGDVNVEHYISGNYTAPASGRGWRLLSSPVYNHTEGQYDLLAFKSSMFITGPGGSGKGFDQSPLNSGTIYRHDQSLPGTLSQKYTTIENMDTRITIGRGIYVFSRGSRAALNAYEQQVLTTPFSNPAPYKITHTGQIYQGNLTVALGNQSSGADGDGFNLLGNPYPGDLLWGSLEKKNLSPFIWQYDPFNKDYKVSDAANTIIPSGTGFFVRVNAGHTSGSLTFAESSKYTANIPVNNANIALHQSSSAFKKDTYSIASHANLNPESLKLKTQLSRARFSQQYAIHFEPGGNDNLDLNDALKIGEGFVNIAGITGQTKLAIEQQGPVDTTKIIKLYIKGWETGAYELKIETTIALLGMADVTLCDTYLKKEIKLLNADEIYNFNIDLLVPESQGSDRFVVRVSKHKRQSAKSKTGLIIYPNPVKDKLYIRSDGDSYKNVRIVFTSFLGEIMNTHQMTINTEESFIDCENMHTGIYLVNVYPLGSEKALKSFKMIKE